MFQHGADAGNQGRNRWSPRLAAITFGLVIQAVTGILLFTLPPGGSIGTWLLYIALGGIGVAHILMGAVLWRDAPEARAVTVEFEGDDIPWHAKRCPVCSAEIADALARGIRRCHACRSHFSTRDLGWMQFDPAGEPASLSPHERRISGRRMIAALACAALAVILIAAYAGIAWPAAPGP